MGLNDPTSLVDFTPTQVATMKCAIILLLATVAYARPADLEEGDSAELLRSDVAHPDDDGGSIMVGHFTYIVDGEAVPLTFVANEKGYQPESSLLPIAPAFPHEIPEWVLEQIAFAEQERAAQSEEK